MAGSGRWDSQLRFWREHLGDAPSVLSLPTDRPASEDRDDRSASYTFSIDPGITTRALRLCLDAGVTPFMAFFTILALLLYRYQPEQRRDVVIGVPFDGRFDRRLGDLIGMFINTLAVRVTCDDNSTFRKQLLRVRETLLNAYGNADIPFDWVVRELKPSRNTRHNPLFQVLFQLQYANDEAIRLGDLEGTGFSPSEQPAKFDITFSLELAGNALSCEMTYAAELFDEPTIARMAADYQELVAAVTAIPDRPVAMFLPEEDEPCWT
jgi:non-ribosomal peptide synthetase component F